MPFNNEIEKTKKEIDVLTAKLELLKEMEKHMSPCKIAYRDWWGEYPTTTWRSDIDRWNAFEAGYDLGYIHGAEGKDKFVPHQEHFGLKLGN